MAFNQEVTSDTDALKGKRVATENFGENLENEDEYFDVHEGLTSSKSFDALLEAYANNVPQRDTQQKEAKHSRKWKRKRGYIKHRAYSGQPKTYTCLNEISPLYLGKPSVAPDDGFESDSAVQINGERDPGHVVDDIDKERMANTYQYSSSSTDSEQRKHKKDTKKLGLENNKGINMQIRLTQKYYPKSLAELIGQSLISQTLSASVAEDHTALFYLFHGPRGTGKTSAARLFGMALNCAISYVEKPCWICDFCENKPDIRELDATRDNMEINSVKVLVQTIKYSSAVSRYKVYIIDECQVLSSESWAILLNGVEECSTKVVIILITTDLAALPDIALSRCQKFSFSKIKDPYIYCRLKEIATAEAIDVDDQTLKLIARKAAGSIRAALTDLEQLRLPGAGVLPNTVRQLVGLIQDEELISLLGMALSGDLNNTISHIRGIIESGIEPITLVTQLAQLIIDILAGSHASSSWSAVTEILSQQEYSSQDLANRLCLALKILSDAEKQLRSSKDGITWLTASLLQLSPVAYSQEGFYSKSIRDLKFLFDGSDKDRYLLKYHDFQGTHVNSNEEEGRMTVPKISKISALTNYGDKDLQKTPIGNSNFIWKTVLDRIQPDGVKDLLLQARGKLVKTNIYKDHTVVHLEFENPQEKEMIEMVKASLLKAFREVLSYPVELEVGPESTKGDIQIIEFPEASYHGTQFGLPDQGKKTRNYRKQRRRKRKQVRIVRLQQSTTGSRTDHTMRSSGTSVSSENTAARHQDDSEHIRVSNAGSNSSIKAGKKISRHTIPTENGKHTLTNQINTSKFLEEDSSESLDDHKSQAYRNIRSKRTIKPNKGKHRRGHGKEQSSESRSGSNHLRYRRESSSSRLLTTAYRGGISYFEGIQKEQHLERMPEISNMKNDTNKAEQGIKFHVGTSKLDKQLSKIAMLCWNKDEETREQQKSERKGKEIRAKEKATKGEKKSKSLLKFTPCKEIDISLPIIRKRNSN